MHTKIKFS